MSEGQITTATAGLPATLADPAVVARIETALDISDRAAIATFGDGAQNAVVAFADRVLSETRNRDLGETGRLLTDILLKAKGLDPASLKEGGFLDRLFSSVQARLERFTRQFEDVASQIDQVLIDLDRQKDVLRRDIAILDDLHEETRAAISALDAHIAAGRNVAERVRGEVIPALKEKAAAAVSAGDGLMESQAVQDAGQALGRLEKRIHYLVQARQIGIQQLPQIRIVQSGDETLIENLQATASLTIPVWKQKMILLLGLTRQKDALELQKTITDATNEMMRQASEMMKDQAIDIERQAQRGIVDLETLEQTNRDLIDTITGVLQVQEEGREKRAAAEQRMEAMTSDLKRVLAAAKA